MAQNIGHDAPQPQAHFRAHACGLNATPDPDESRRATSPRIASIARLVHVECSCTTFDHGKRSSQCINVSFHEPRHGCHIHISHAAGSRCMRCQLSEFCRPSREGIVRFPILG
jgi:hypothetical protein